MIARPISRLLRIVRWVFAPLLLHRALRGRGDGDLALDWLEKIRKRNQNRDISQ